MRILRLATLASAGLLALGLLVPAVASADPPVVVGQCTESALRSAITNAPAGATITFGCDGTITLTSAGGSTIEIDKSVTLDGTGHDVTISGGGLVSLFFNTNLSTFTVKHLTLADGSSQDYGLPGGGAVFNVATLIADDVTFRDNHAFNYGGAIYNYGKVANATISDSRFVDNVVTCPVTGQGGGAIAVYGGGTTTITGSDFDGNSSVGGASGGAILGNLTYQNYLDGPIAISNSTFENNLASINEPNYYNLLPGGGAVAVYNHALTITDSTFTANSTTTIAGVAAGGAVLVSTGDPNGPLPPQPASISGSTFTGNLAEHSTDYGYGLGGALVSSGPPLTVTSSHFVKNGAAQAGGIFNSGPLQLSGSTLRGNYASGAEQQPPFVGGLYNVGTATVANTTFRDNPKVNCASPQGSLIDAGGNFETPGRTCFAPRPPNRQPVADGMLSGVSFRIAPGSTITVTGTGFGAWSRVAIALYPASTYRHPIPLATVSADRSGTVTATITIPSNVRGVQSVLAAGAAPNGTTRYLATQTDVEPIP